MTNIFASTLKNPIIFGEVSSFTHYSLHCFLRVLLCVIVYKLGDACPVSWPLLKPYFISIYYLQCANDSQLGIVGAVELLIEI